jgi:hypothetical protein
MILIKIETEFSAGTAGKCPVLIHHLITIPASRSSESLFTTS